MLEENKIIELVDEDLEKVSGGYGDITPNSDGYYVLVQGNTYVDTNPNICNGTFYTLLESITTNNIMETVKCLIQIDHFDSYEGYVGIEYLIQYGRKWLF